MLVVEDEALLRWSIVQTLAQGGHSVVEAGDAKTAVHTIAETSAPFDVVLLDLRLPDSHDLGLLTAVREMMPGSAVVLMTAHGTPDLATRALDLGVYRMISKPFDMDGLEALVQDADQSRNARA